MPVIRDAMRHRWSHCIDNSLGSTTECTLWRFILLGMKVDGKLLYWFAKMNTFAYTSKLGHNARWCESDIPSPRIPFTNTLVQRHWFNALIMFTICAQSWFVLYPMWSIMSYDLLWCGFVAFFHRNGNNSIKGYTSYRCEHVFNGVCRQALIGANRLVPSQLSIFH